MKNIIKKLADLEKRISTIKGPFVLFALFLREDAFNVWDLLVSASWASKNKPSTLRYISKQLNETLTPRQMLRLSRIVIIEPNDPALKALHAAVEIEHSLAELKDCSVFGIQIKQAFLITSKRRTSPKQRH